VCCVVAALDTAIAAAMEVVVVGSGWRCCGHGRPPSRCPREREQRVVWDENPPSRVSSEGRVHWWVSDV